MTEFTWPFDVSVFEKLRFRPSTLHHLAGVFNFLRPKDRFRNGSFSVAETAVLVWTVGQTGEKKDAFSNLSVLVWTGPYSPLIEVHVCAIVVVNKRK